MKNVSTFLLVSLFCLFFSKTSLPQLDIVNVPLEFDQFNTIPPEYGTVGGTVTFTGPLANTARTLQFLIHDTLLTDLVGKELLGISWRLPVSATANWPAAEVTYTAYDIYLSESVTPSLRSLTFANNIVGPQTQVRNGPLVIPADAYTFNQVPNAYGPQIIFNDSWLYTGGHLLIEIRTSVSTGTSRSVDAVGTSITGYGSLFSACWGSGATATTGSQGNFTIMQLTSDLPVPVELTSFTAIAVGNTVELKWETATETNNRGFEVQRKDRSSEFEPIAFINGNGTTSELSSYLFSDNKLSTGQYSYRLKQLDYNGAYEFSNVVDVDVNTPEYFELFQNYPNPFNPSTLLGWNSPFDGWQSLKIYDVLGNEITTLIDEYKPAGSYNLQFNASSLSNGVYFYTLRAGSFVQTKKMILLK